MALGRKLVLPGTFTDSTLPALADIDPIESSGSLLLIDPTHPALSWPTGVPAHAATVPNVLWSKAATAIGSGTVTTLAPTVNRNGLTGINGTVERTTKGGLHIIPSQVNNISGSGSDNFYMLEFAASSLLWVHLRTYYTTHAYFISAWSSVTRTATNGAVYHQWIGDYAGGIPSNHKIIGLTGAVSEAGILGTREATTFASGTGPRIKNIARLTYSGTATLSGNPNLTMSMFACGNVGVSSTAPGRGKAPSLVMYRVYLEDLTISGRTYAQVDAIDFAQYTAQVLTAGGRYYGDTFTDPTTIA